MGLLGRVQPMNRVTLTESDLQTIINALCMAQSECQADARRYSQAGTTDAAAKNLAAAFSEAARSYSDLADQLIDADVITSTLALVDESPSLRILPGGRGKPS